MSIPRIMLMENHDTAYYAWKKFSFSRETVVHIDAHFDVLADSTNNIHFGNFLFQGMKEKMIKKLYWVIPGDRGQFFKDLFIIKKIISTLATYDSFSPPHPHFDFKDGLLETSLFGTQIVICTIEDIPPIPDAVLLDIDIDFFIIDRVRDNSNLSGIGERKPWMRISPFIDIINKKIQKIKFTTIAYSVNEGYTPLIYKTIGDEIAKAFGYSDAHLEQRLLAGTYFNKFRSSFDKGNIKEAQKHFRKTISLNSSYLVPENTYGNLYLRNMDFKRAESEFSKMLKVNGKDVNCLMGLGIVNIYKKKLETAARYFNGILEIDMKNSFSMLYLSAIALNQKEYPVAQKLLQTTEESNPHWFYPKYLLGKIYEKKDKELSEQKYKDAVKTGMLFEIPLGLELLMD